VTSRWLTAGLAIALPLLGASVSGCTVTAEPAPAAVIVPTQPSSTLVVDWTIELRTNPADCSLSGAATIQIQVITTSGLDAGTYEQACSAFSTSITLAPGSYSASALLVDAVGQARTTSVIIQPFTLLGNDVLHTPVDFPAASFF
jgi:hypothetical protein